MLRVAMIDAGRTGKVHAATVATHPQARLAPVCDLFIEATKALAEPLGTRASADATEAFSADNVDAVVIGPPVPLHAEHVLVAARTGRATLCKKSVASSIETARALAGELATLEHPPIMMGFQHRYDPLIARAQWFAVEGRTGRVEQLTVVPCSPTLPSAEYLAQSGGVSKDMTIHNLDRARLFLGGTVSVNATRQKLNPVLAGVDDFDGAVTILWAASDAATITKSTRRCTNGYDQKVEAFGSEGEAVVENLRATSIQASDATGSVQQEIYLDFFPERYADAYRDELTALIDVMSNGSPVTLIVKSGVAALVLAKVAECSTRSGQAMEVTK